MAAAIQDRYTEVTDELAQTGIDKTGIVKEKQDELASKAEQPNINEEKKKQKKENERKRKKRKRDRNITRTNE